MFQDMLWSNCEGRFHLYFYVGVFRSEETKTTSNLACICERHLWEYLKRMKRQDLPNDIVLISDRWKKISSMKKLLFVIYISKLLQSKSSSNILLCKGLVKEPTATQSPARKGSSRWPVELLRGCFTTLKCKQRKKK